MNYISPQDWMDKYAKDANYQLIDIRESYECTDMLIDSEHIPMQELAQHPEKLNATKKNVILCQSGKRAEALANFIETEFNIPNLAVIEGGYASLSEII